MLKDGRWIVQYLNPNPPPRLKRVYFGRGVRAETRAKQFDKSVTKRAHDNTYPTESFGVLAQRYLTAKRATMQDSTMDRLLPKLTGVILPELGALAAGEITPDRVDLFVRARLEAGVTRTTVHNDVTYIQAILNWSVRQGYIPKNPLANYRKPARDDAVIAPVTAAELRKILTHAPPHLVRALALSYYTGLRPGVAELLRLRWTDIDWDLMVIFIQSARKGGPRSRSVPIHHSFAETLKSWWRDDRFGDGYIITYRGRPVKSLKTVFATAKKKAGITRRLPLYSFRHAFVSNLLAMGADLKVVSEIAGHSSPDTTMRIYQHTNLRFKHQEINKLPALVIPGNT